MKTNQVPSNVRRGGIAISILLAMVLIACLLGIWLAVSRLPAIAEQPDHFFVHESNRTWVGHEVTTAYALGICLVLLIYTVKRLIALRTTSVRDAAFWYCLAIIASLPYIWFFIVLDWRNPHIYRVTCWIYDPIGIWVVPTVSFIWDIAAERRTSWRTYLLRSLIEIVIVFPAWLVFWLYFSFFILLGGWI